MRYFRYPLTNRVAKAAQKAEIARLTKEGQRIARHNKAVETIAVCLSLAIMAVCYAGCFYAIGLIPESDSIVVNILCDILKFLLHAVAVIGCFILGWCITLPIWNKITATPRAMDREVLFQACAHLRKYYGLQEPYIITKCFSCSDEKFNNHDVCIFVHGEELRITTDLFRGFAYGDSDLGCYAFRADEISLAKQERDGHLALELKAEKVTFLLGYRAKSFIYKHYLSM